MLAGFLLTVAVASSVQSLQVETSAPRVILLVTDIVATLAIAILVSDRRDLLRTLALGAVLVLPFFILADAAELRWLIGRGPELWRLGTLTVQFDEVQTLGLLPRFGGLVFDANRAGFIFVVYWVVIARGDQRPWRRRGALGLIALLIAATFSRSTLLTIMAASIVALATRSKAPTAKAAAVGLLILSMALGGALVNTRFQTVALDAAGSLIGKRLSTQERGARGHITLIQRGIAEGSSTIPRGLVGLGYGNSYLVLEDFFPGNRYGNFHSLYVTMFAEAGIFAFLLIVALLFTPVFLGGPWRALVAGSVVFNIFYQLPTEPAFWFLLALAWLTLRTRASESEAPEHAISLGGAPRVA
jgi:hypothetical protein